MSEVKIKFTPENTNPMFIRTALCNRNFAGGPSKYRPQGGKREFSVRVPEELAYQLLNDGWNVSIDPSRRPGPDEPLYGFLPVEARFDNFPPDIAQLERNPDGTVYKKIQYSEANVADLDTVVFSEIHMVLKPYHWETPTGSGIKAYLKELYFFAEKATLDADFKWGAPPTFNCEPAGDDSLPFEI